MISMPKYTHSLHYNPPLHLAMIAFLLNTTLCFVGVVGNGYAMGAEVARFGDINAIDPKFSVPLEMPVLENGINPIVELNYNRQIGQGPLGIGWRLGAGGAISRCPIKSQSYQGQDKQRSLVADINSNEVFCFDGQRVRLRPVDNDLESSVYADELYQRTIFRKLGNSAGLFFKANTPNGLKYRYGSNPTSKVHAKSHAKSHNRMHARAGNRIVKEVTVAWQLNQIIDLNGQAIDYRYSTEGPYRRLASIEYGQFRVLFYYDFLPDKMRGGNTAYTQHPVDFSMINRIEVQANQEPLFSYDFTYQLFGRTGALLKHISRCREGDCIPMTRFRWELNDADTVQHKADSQWRDHNHQYGMERVNLAYVYSGAS